MLRTFPYAIALVLLLPCLADAQTASPPPALAPHGDTPLPLTGQAHRTDLLGTVELYSLALYADAGNRDSLRLTSPQTAKALRIEITHVEDLHRRVTRDWRRELIPALNAPAIAQLRSTFAPLQDGDVVLIEYTPTKGTLVRVNKAVTLSGVSHDLMLSFLDHWLGQRPVSEEMKRSLLSMS